MATPDFNKTAFDLNLTSAEWNAPLLTQQQARFLFQFFRDAPLFKWEERNNNCEDRAHAICLALHHWNIPVYKGWVFGGAFLNRNAGQLQNNWGYHVAALITFQEDTDNYYIIDPATATSLTTLPEWANAVTATPTSFHCITSGDTYIFDPGGIKPDTWFLQNRQNYKWTMQGLAGINGVTRTGKAQLVFQKARVQKWERDFKKLLRQKPNELLLS